MNIGMANPIPAIPVPVPMHSDCDIKALLTKLSAFFIVSARFEQPTHKMTPQ